MDAHKVDRVIVARSADLLSDDAIVDILSECLVWFTGKLDTGEAVPSATVLFSDASGYCICTAQIHHRDGDWDVDNFKAADLQWPLSAILEDSQTHRLTVRIELDRQGWQ